MQGYYEKVPIESLLGVLSPVEAFVFGLQQKGCIS